MSNNIVIGSRVLDIKTFEYVLNLYEKEGLRGYILIQRLKEDGWNKEIILRYMFALDDWIDA